MLYNVQFSQSHLLKSPQGQEIQRLFGITEEELTDQVVVPPSEIQLGQITYITGLSGSGKSTLLRQIQKKHTDAFWVKREIDESLTPIEFLGAETSEALSWLTRFGLGEAFLMLKPVYQLSDGQKFRLQLAKSMYQQQNCMILCDEFLSLVDRQTSQVIAYNVQKICRRQNIQLVVATAHRDLQSSLRPDVVIRMDLNGVLSVDEDKGVNWQAPLFSKEDLKIERGEIDDYFQFQRFHYSKGDDDKLIRSDLLDHVVVARYGELTIGVALITKPFPKTLESIPLFAEINQSIKVSERVVIHPSFRGCGITKLLQPMVSGEVKYIFSQSAFGLKVNFKSVSQFQEVEHPNKKRNEPWQEYLHKSEHENVTEKELQSLLVQAAVLKRKRYLHFFIQLLKKELADHEVQFVDLLLSHVQRDLQNWPEAQLIEEARPFPMAAFLKKLL